MASFPKCRVCKTPMGDGVASVIVGRLGWHDALGPRYDDGHYLHLACAIRVQHEKVRLALFAMHRELVGDMLVEVEKTSPELADEIRHRVPHPRKASPLDDPETLALLAQLEASPDDRGLLEVLGDHLLQVGDERGDLIAIHLADSQDPRCPELVEMLSPRIGARDGFEWGIGFLSALVIRLDGYSFTSRATPLAHPSCRLLQRLSVREYRQDSPPIEIIPSVIPRSLRTLEIVGTLAPVDLSALPHLATLSLDQCTRVAHPTASRLDLRYADQATLEAYAIGLPGVRSLRIESGELSSALIREILDANGGFARLDELTLMGIPSDPLMQARSREHGFRIIEWPRP